MPTITDLYIYPVKSCAGIRLEQADLWETGLLLDRFWMVIDSNDAFVTQRELPRLALVRTQWKFGELRLSAPGMMSIGIPAQGFDYAQQRRVRATVWNDVVDAYLEDELVGTWFSDFCGQSLRVVRIDPDARRYCDRQWTGDQLAITQFADAFPLLVVSRASLHDLNERLQSAGHSAITMDRFRPNIVIDGVPAYAEDTIETLANDDYELRLVKPCARCRISNTDQQTAERGRQPLELLSTYRRSELVAGIPFGMNAIITRGADAAIVRTGDVLQ